MFKCFKPVSLISIVIFSIFLFFGCEVSNPKKNLAIENEKKSSEINSAEIHSSEIPVALAEQPSDIVMAFKKLVKVLHSPTSYKNGDPFLRRFPLNPLMKPKNIEIETIEGSATEDLGETLNKGRGIWSLMVHWIRGYRGSDFMKYKTGAKNRISDITYRYFNYKANGSNLIVNGVIDFTNRTSWFGPRLLTVISDNIKLVPNVSNTLRTTGTFKSKLIFRTGWYVNEYINETNYDRNLIRGKSRTVFSDDNPTHVPLRDDECLTVEFQYKGEVLHMGCGKNTPLMEELMRISNK